jgi:hypothetical protein
VALLADAYDCEDCLVMLERSELEDIYMDLRDLSRSRISIVKARQLRSFQFAMMNSLLGTRR